MKKGLTEIVFILDRSGSMAGLEEDTIGGYNSMLLKQKKQEGEVVVSTVLFNHDCQVIHNRVNLKEVSPLRQEDYQVWGSTALLDAIGRAIHKIGNVQKYTPEEFRAEKVLFVITTDGMENASKEYSYNTLRHMIERQQERYGWEFIFLGANIDAIKTAGRFGIRKDRAVNYHSDRRGTDLNYAVISETISELRCSGCISEDWKEKIDEDYQKRSK